MLENKRLQEMLLRYKDADYKAFEEFYFLTKPYIISYLRRHLRDCVAADDIFQDVYFRVHRYVASYRENDGNAIGWLFSIARNALVDHFRKNRRMESLPEEQLSADANLESSLEARDELDRLLKSLSPADRQLIELKMIHDLSYEDLSKMQKMEPAALRQRVSRLLKRLRKI